MSETPDRAAILAKIAEILSDVAEIDDVVLTETSSAADFEEWDSVNHVRLLIALEREYGFEFRTDEIGAVETVGQLIDLVAAKLG